MQPQKNELDGSALSTALARARQALLSSQRPDGSWGCDTDIGPIGLATQLLAEAQFAPLAAEDAAAARRTLARLQRADGSFPPYPHAEYGTVSATALGWAAFLCCGATQDDPALVRARDAMMRLGGLAAVTHAFRERSDVA